MSPNGRLLAVGMRAGEILIYGISANANSSTEDILIEKKIWIKPSHASSAINCITFSPDSTLLSSCCSENVINTYNLDVNEPLKIPWSSHNLYEISRQPFHSVTNLT